MSGTDVVYTVTFVKVKGYSLGFIGLKTITDLIKSNCHEKHLASQQRDGKQKIKTIWQAVRKKIPTEVAVSVLQRYMSLSRYV